MNNANDVYKFVDQLKLACQKAGETKLFEQLDNALRLGSSGLEILGAIRGVLLKNHALIQELLDSTNRAQVDQVIAFVDKAYGRAH